MDFSAIYDVTAIGKPVNRINNNNNKKDPGGFLTCYM